MELEAKHARELNQLQNQIQNLLMVQKEENAQERLKRRPSYALARKASTISFKPIMPHISQTASLSREPSKSVPKTLPESGFNMIENIIDVEDDVKPMIKPVVETETHEQNAAKPKKIKKIKTRVVTYLLDIYNVESSSATSSITRLWEERSQEKRKLFLGLTS